MSYRAWCPLLLALWLAVGCAGGAHGAASGETLASERPPHDSQPAPAEAAAEAATEPTEPAPAAEEASPGAVPEKLPEPPPALPTEVNAGEIPRAALDAVLARGVGRFLQQVEIERHPSEGRFQGWMLHSVFASQPVIQNGSILKPGDVVLRVNNHSVERPEQFLSVWQSLSTAAEINIDVVRAGQPSRVRYLIVD